LKDHPSQWINGGLTCRDVAERTTDYLEDRLPVFKKIRVGLHVTSCAGCRSYVLQIGRVFSALRSLPKLYPSPVNRLSLRRQFAARHAN